MPSTYVSRVSTVERAIIDQIIKDALGTGCLIDVGDGDEFPTRPSRFTSTITDWIGHTEITVLVFEKEDKTKLGHVVLVHGNGCDVISDYSANDFTEEVVKNANILADTIF